MKKNLSIELYRFLFSVLVALFHFKEYDLEHHHLFIWSCLGVEFFFVLSGFFLMKNLIHYLDNHMDDFFPVIFIFKKYKLFFPYVFLFCFINGLYNIIFLKFNIIEYFLNSFWEILLLSETGVANPYNTTWYLSAFIIATFFILCTIKLLKKNFIYIFCPFIILIGLAFLSQHHGSIISGIYINLFFSDSILRALVSMCIGCIIYYIHNETHKKFKNYIYKHNLQNLISLLESILYVAIFYLMIFVDNEYMGRFSLIIPFIFGFLIYLSFNGFSITANIKNNKLIYYLGKISFYIYLDNLVIAHIFQNEVDIPYGLAIFLYIITCILLAIIVERSANLIRKIFLSRRTYHETN